jgi:hypothetical protein
MTVGDQAEDTAGRSLDRRHRRHQLSQVTRLLLYCKWLFYMPP